MTKNTVEVIWEDAARKRMRTEVAASIVNRHDGHDPMLGPPLPAREFSVSGWTLS